MSESRGWALPKSRDSLRPAVHTGTDKNTGAGFFTRDSTKSNHVFLKAAALVFGLQLTNGVKSARIVNGCVLFMGLNLAEPA